MSIETIRISEKAKRQLIAVKQKTGIEHWNILCRWAFCLSMAEKSSPSPANIPLDSNVEMSWRTFGGPNHEIYWALLKMQCHKDGLELTPLILSDRFLLHLHRGISILHATQNS